MTSIFEGQPPKTRPFPVKTRVIWVLGMYIFIYRCGTSNFGGFQLPWPLKTRRGGTSSYQVTRDQIRRLAVWDDVFSTWHERDLLKWISMDKTMKDITSTCFVCAQKFLDINNLWICGTWWKNKSSISFPCFVFHTKIGHQIMAVMQPLGQSKRRRIDGIHGYLSGVGEKRIELEVLSISGECMLTLNVADSMLGCELWENILDKLPFQPGHQLVLSHNTSKLVLHESLERQGFRSEQEQVSATYVPVNLLAALRFAHGCNVEDQEFSLNGITEVTEVGDHNMPALLRNLPTSLHTLTFAPGFNPGLYHDVRLPPGLQSLNFGQCFNQSLDNVTWPEGLQNLTFGRNFDQKLDNVTWPAGLQRLTFGRLFDQSLDNVTWPAGLQNLTFGLNFDQKLDNVTWPAGLQSLTFGWYFDQSLDSVTWPAGLQSLTFGANFNQNLNNVTWPAGLQSLTFGDGFEQDLEKVTWPAGLQSLTFQGDVNQNLDKVTWPAGLQSLTFRRRCQSNPGQGDMASRPSKLDFWLVLRSEPGQRDMASRPSKFDFWWEFQSESGQCHIASWPSKFDFWRWLRAGLG